MRRLRSPTRSFLRFYSIAVIIVVAVMAAAMLVPAPDVMGELLAFLRARGLTTNLVNILRFALTEQPWGWLIVVFAAAPSLAALAVSAASDGPAGLGPLLRRLHPLPEGRKHGHALRTYLVLFGVSAAVLGFYLWWGGRVGSPDAVQASRAALGGSPALIGLSLLAGHFVDEGGLLEELGWRGYGLPRLLERWSPMAGSVILGLAWWAWHLPREAPVVLSGGLDGAFLRSQMLFLVLCVMQSVVITWAWLGTGGSVWAGVLVHGGSNVWNKALGATVNPWAGTDVRTLLLILLGAAAAVALLRRPSAGRRSPGD